MILWPLQPRGTRKEIQVNQKEQKLEIHRHTCGWSYSTTRTLCGLPQHVEKYSTMAHACNPNTLGGQGRRIA
uniref:Uncharacterized protein n=1 Tax=Theropithecus gelada TaxID=9565 RepID=A0A8D2K3K2_THEGE